MTNEDLVNKIDFMMKETQAEIEHVVRKGNGRIIYLLDALWNGDPIPETEGWVREDNGQPLDAEEMASLKAQMRFEAFREWEGRHG